MNIENSLNFDWNAMIKDGNNKLIGKKHDETNQSFLEIEKKCMNDAKHEIKPTLSRLEEKLPPKRFPLKPINKMPIKVNDDLQSEIKINKNIKINKHKTIINSKNNLSDTLKMDIDIKNLEKDITHLD